MRIGVVGGGVVGQATARSYIEHVDEVRVYDVLKERRTHGLFETLDCELIFLCLPTPQKKDSRECDVSAIEDFFCEAAGRKLNGLNWVLRSTVPIGTTRRLREQYDLPNIVHSPEFLTARVAVTDAQMPARNIIGGFGDCGGLLHELYHRRFPGVPIHHMTSDESEAVKLFVNGFGATVIAYWNECRCLAESRGLNWGRVMDGVLSDGRIPHSWSRVPGPDQKYGFGGACLPKDLASLTHLLGDEAAVTLAALERNHRDRARPPLNTEAVIREALARDMA